ncbi:MAG: RNA polymerase subunit sigma [Acidobacteria bacterium]|nr:MAG: RNA polymerase subunit sigma [Acidobacteriota bacterium]
MEYRPQERSSSVSKYLSDIGEFPLLTREEEQKLAACLSNKEKVGALNELVESNLSFVVKIASEYRNLGLPFEDLLNEGNIGLIEAAHHFDHLRGTKFITYAIWWIRKSILRALSQHSNLVRIPNYQLKKVKNVRATERALVRELGRRPDREEISRELQSTIAKIDEILQIKLRELSLDDKIGRDKDTPISDYLVDEGSTNPEEELLREESQSLIRLALKDLSAQEQAVIINRFGLQGGRTFTLKEIGERMGISRERVRQIEAQAMKRLKKLITCNRALTKPATRARGATVLARLEAARLRLSH